VWLGTCIGARNYLDFILFLISLTSLLVFTEYVLWKEIVEVNSLDTSDLNLALRERLHVSFIIPFCFLFFAMVTLLLCFHIFLICKNVTTHEYLKNIYEFGNIE
jgi:palmitoyltransferase ZDHHC9/14/18